MSIMIDLPPSMAQEAREYATVQGTTLEQMLVDCLKVEIERRRRVKFNCADAYAEDDAVNPFKTLTTSTNITTRR